MKRNIVAISSSISIKEVARVLATEEFHALPVVDNNKLVGIVTITDLIKYLLNQVLIIYKNLNTDKCHKNISNSKLILSNTFIIIHHETTHTSIRYND